MPNMNQAPVLLAQGSKKKNNQDLKEQFYDIPLDIATIIFNELGNASAQLRIMIVLIGTKQDGSFKMAEATILNRTGLKHSPYINARTALVEKGFIKHEDGKIIVCYDWIRMTPQDRMSAVKRYNEQKEQK